MKRVHIFFCCMMLSFMTHAQIPGDFGDPPDPSPPSNPDPGDFTDPFDPVPPNSDPGDFTDPYDPPPAPIDTYVYLLSSIAVFYGARKVLKQ